MTTLRTQFLEGMSSVAATVSIVATDGPAGRSGVTVSAMSSVSADSEKPTLLVCVNKLGTGAMPIIENGVFSVNILRDEQSFVSDTFAGRYGDKGEDKFACAEWVSGETGAPVLLRALATFECRLVRNELVGQHYVFFGEVERIHLGEQGRALIYAHRSYGTPLTIPAAGEPSGGVAKGRLSLACLSSFAPLHLPALLMRSRKKLPGLRVDVIEGDQAQVANLIETGQAHLGLLYDRKIPNTLEATHLLTQQPYALFAASAPLARHERVTLAQLAAEPLVLLDQPLSRDYVAGLFADAALEPNIGMRPSSFELARSLVGNCLGYSVLVTRPHNDVSYDGHLLVARPIADDLTGISICLARRRAIDPPDLADRFASECAAYFAEQSV